jgi:hypothetical protein
MVARITKYLNKYVHRGLCLIYMFSFYFWSPSYHGFLLLTWSTGPMELSTGNSYQAEALPNVLRYHTCRSSHPEDRKMPITDIKWDAKKIAGCTTIMAQFSSSSGLQDSLTYMYYTSKCVYMSLLYKYIQ